MTWDWKCPVPNLPLWETWYKMSTMLESGLDVDAVITHRMDAKDFDKGFEVMNSGKSGKVILDWRHMHDHK